MSSNSKWLSATRRQNCSRVWATLTRSSCATHHPTQVTWSQPYTWRARCSTAQLGPASMSPSHLSWHILWTEILWKCRLPLNVSLQVKNLPKSFLSRTSTSTRSSPKSRSITTRTVRNSKPASSGRRPSSNKARSCRVLPWKSPSLKRSKTIVQSRFRTRAIKKALSSFWITRGHPVGRHSILNLNFSLKASFWSIPTRLPLWLRSTFQQTERRMNSRRSPNES